MNELRDPEAQLQQIGSDQQNRDRDQELYDLVTSGIPPSPPYSELSLMNTSGVSGLSGVSILDPTYSAHLFASFVASPSFQLPILIPTFQIPVLGKEQWIVATTKPAIGLPTTNNLNAQLELISALLNEQATNGLITAELISPENHIKRKEEIVDNVSIDMNTRPTIIPIDKTSAIGHKKCENGGQSGNNNHYNNEESLPRPHQSNQSSRDKVFTCLVCSRNFGFKQVLQNHMRTHTGERPYSCKICPKKFSRQHSLKQHIKLHTGEKPYSCTYCDRQFVQVGNLRSHLRVHTGERPYSCELCSSRFAYSYQRKAHMLLHKDIKPSASSVIKRERKSMKTRHIIRISGRPVSATVTSGLNSIIPDVPAQEIHPEDLSREPGNGTRGPNFSGSDPSVGASI